MRLPPLWQQAGSYRALEDRRLIGALWPTGAVTGMVPTVEIGTMNIQIGAGAAAVPDGQVAGAGYLCASDAPETVPLTPPFPPTGQDRIDLVVVRPRDSQAGGSDNDWIFDPIVGVPSANPIVPLVPNGCLAIAQQRIIGGDAFIIVPNLLDRRPLAETSDSRVAKYASGGTTLSAAVNVAEIIVQLELERGVWALTGKAFMEVSVGSNTIIWTFDIHDGTRGVVLDYCATAHMAALGGGGRFPISLAATVTGPCRVEMRAQRNVVAGTQLAQSVRLMAVPTR